MPENAALRNHVIELLKGGHAHLTFDQAVENFPIDRIGVRPNHLPHSAWELVEHIRIAQNDILQFSRSADHVSPKWPDGYWPPSPAPDRESKWNDALRSIREDLAAFCDLVQDPEVDLLLPFPWGDGQTLLREALMLADHNSYHLGQVVLVRRSLLG